MARLVHEILDETALRLPNKTAIVTEGGAITYSNLVKDSRAIAAHLQDLGMSRGDRLAILLPNGIPAITSIMAASRLGATFFLVNKDTKNYHLYHILDDADPSVIITSRARSLSDEVTKERKVLTLEEDWNRALESLPNHVRAQGISSDPLCLIYTSGSTSKPQGVISTHRNITFAVSAILERLQIRESDVIGNFLPLSFDYGLYQAFLAFGTGATLALGSKEDMVALPNKLTEWSVTALAAVPNMVHILAQMLRRSPHELPRLRLITNTGAHLHQTYIRELRDLLPQCAIYIMFGLTECKRVSILLPSEYGEKPTSVGRPLGDTECLIVDDNGELLPPGQIGELVVRGPHVMSGYWRSPELTAQRFRAWGPGLECALFTGDMCSMDEDGYIFFHGRTDDIYKSQGYRVSTLELESAACDIPGVYDAAVTPPSDYVGPVLFVVSEVPISKIQKELRNRLEEFRLPDHIVSIRSMPRNNNGKVDKPALLSFMKDAFKDD